MGAIEVVVFGAGGRAGRRVVAEAARRGHRVTAVVRDPSRHPGLAARGAAAVVTGDAADPASVAAVAAGHDVAVSAVHRADQGASQQFVAAANALVAGLDEAGVGRLVLVGIGTALVGPDGVALHGGPGLPPEAVVFSRGHADELEALRVAGAAVDWAVLAPPPVVLADTDVPGGPVVVGPDDRLLPEVPGAEPFSYADLAVAVVDEAEAPTRHRGQFAVARGETRGPAAGARR